jgi:hypothetical protein
MWHPEMFGCETTPFDFSKKITTFSSLSCLGLQLIRQVQEVAGYTA